MPNTQTSVPAFVAAQVLTAQQQTEINTGIPVFATTVTRDAAFGGAGEKALAEGQFAYIEATNATQYYDGAAWQTVGASALTLITAVSFSAQTTVAFANSIFTSTYNRYLIQISAKSSSDNSAVTMQLRDNTGTKSAASYAGANQGGTYDGSSTTQGTNFQTSFKMGNTGSDYQNYYSFYVSRPTDATLYSVWSGTAFIRSNGVGNVIGAVLGGTYNVNEAHTGLVFTFASTSTGDYRVYGLADS